MFIDQVACERDEEWLDYYGGMGYKAFYFREKFPSTDFFKALDPRMEHFIEAYRFTRIS